MTNFYFMLFKKGDLVRLGQNVGYLGLDDREAYKRGQFTEGMVIGRSMEKPEVIFINYRHEPSLFSGGIENMFSDCDFKPIPGNPYEQRERIIEELVNKNYRRILEERSII